jgi:ABC-type antimicrobial peptide transport system permease subunit
MVQTLQEAVEEDLSDSKQHQRLAVGFALLAVILAALGVFAVLSFQVTLRMRDLGIRAALGARPDEIARMVVKNGLSLTLMGLVAGLLASEAVGHLLRSLLDRMPGSSAMLYAGVTLAFLLVGCAAAWMPAWRASKVDPAVVLRQD